MEVSYASLHAIDHTHIVIPITKGWDKDVGITITPGKFGTSVGADKIVSVLTAGTVDISSGSTVFSLAGYSTNPELRRLHARRHLSGLRLHGRSRGGLQVGDRFRRRGHGAHRLDQGDRRAVPRQVAGDSERGRHSRLHHHRAGKRRHEHGRHHGQQLRHRFEDRCRDDLRSCRLRRRLGTWPRLDDLGRLRAGDDVTPHLAVRGGHAGLQGAPGRVPRRLGDNAGTTTRTTKRRSIASPA